MSHFWSEPTPLPGIEYTKVDPGSPASISLIVGSLVNLEFHFSNIKELSGSGPDLVADIAGLNPSFAYSFFLTYPRNVPGAIISLFTDNDLTLRISFPSTWVTNLVDINITNGSLTFDSQGNFTATIHPPSAVIDARFKGVSAAGAGDALTATLMLVLTLFFWKKI
jgi:hypothetical protein